MAGALLGMTTASLAAFHRAVDAFRLRHLLRFACSRGKGVHHPRRVDESCASIDGNCDSQRFRYLFRRRSVLARRMDMCRDAPVALACDTDCERNQFARLRVEPSGLGAGVTQLAIAPQASAG